MVGHPRINTKTSLRFATAADFFASNAYALPGGDTEAMPEYVATSSAIVNHNSYLSDFTLGGGVGDSHFKAHELEGMLREGDVDSALIRGRLDFSGDTVDSLTTHSFEIAIPATTLSIMELLRDILGNGVDNDLDGVIDDSDELALGTESSLIPNISET